MCWHAATLGSIGLAMAVRGGLRMKSWPWLLVAAWGFTNCLFSGRRKATYMLAVFAVVLVWRYFRRLTKTQLVAVGLTGAILGVITYQVASNEKTDVYT